MHILLIFLLVAMSFTVVALLLVLLTGKSISST